MGMNTYLIGNVLITSSLTVLAGCEENNVEVIDYLKSKKNSLVLEIQGQKTSADELDIMIHLRLKLISVYEPVVVEEKITSLFQN